MAKKRRAQSNPKDHDRKKRSCKNANDDDDVKQNSAEVTAVSNELFRNSDIGSVIFSFLEARELLRLASCSKDYLARLSYKDVVRSTLMTGKKALISVTCFRVKKGEKKDASHFHLLYFNRWSTERIAAADCTIDPETKDLDSNTTASVAPRLWKAM